MIRGIENKVELYAFIIFGSRARGNALEHSDYDIVIIANFQEKYLYRGKWIVQMAPDVGVDIFCYTPKEFENMFNQFNLTAIDAIDEGIFLKGGEFLKKYQKRLSYFKEKGLKKEDHVLFHPSLEKN